MGCGRRDAYEHKETQIDGRAPLKKPLLVFDGDCAFCRVWIARWRSTTGDKVDYAPYQQAAVQFLEIPLKDFQRAVQLVMPDGRVFQGAEAVFQALAAADRSVWLWFYRNLPGFKTAAERAYRFIAGHRPLFSRLTCFFWGASPGPFPSLLTRWFFLRALGLIYLVAFISLGVQVMGLLGSNGVLPAADFLARVAERFGGHRFDLLPTVFWWNSSDVALQWLWKVGAVFSLSLVIGLCPVISAAGAWACYLSYLSVGQDFLSFQWDVLLVETGFLAIFLAPLQLRPSIAREAEPSGLVVWLFRLLLFRLMFLSGAVKLLSGDPTWRQLTALQFHYETQPLPTWIGWYAHQLPAAFQTFSTVVVFTVELVLPFFLFLPRRLRNIACGVFIAFQTLIFATGNYCFFNLLAAALAVVAMDDGCFPRWLLKKIKERRDWSADFPAVAWPRWILALLAVVVLVQSAAVFSRRAGAAADLPGPLTAWIARVDSWRIANGYGLFAVMTTKRLEIVVEGSDDGERWRVYEFKYKPGDLAARPAFVAPHQPRLDWQMWFAALGSYRQNRWFLEFCARLLQGSSDVRALLKYDPFPAGPPRFIRASLYEYHFTDGKMRRVSGRWWRRDRVGDYSPVLSLK